VDGARGQGGGGGAGRRAAGVGRYSLVGKRFSAKGDLMLFECSLRFEGMGVSTEYEAGSEEQAREMFHSLLVRLGHGQIKSQQIKVRLVKKKGA
jgi:hypothetical protein